MFTFINSIFKKIVKIMQIILNRKKYKLQFFWIHFISHSLLISIFLFLLFRSERIFCYQIFILLKKIVELLRIIITVKYAEFFHFFHCCTNMDMVYGRNNFLKLIHISFLREKKILKPFLPYTTKQIHWIEYIWNNLSLCICVTWYDGILIWIRYYYFLLWIN